MLIVIHMVARIALFIKYKGSVDPSMCAVQSKALIKIAHIQGEPVYILETWGLPLLFALYPRANPALSSIHQKGGDCKGIFIPQLVLVIDDNALAD